MKEDLEGSVYRSEHWQLSMPSGGDSVFRWSAYVTGDGCGEDLQLLAAAFKDGLGWQKVPRGSAMFSFVQSALRDFCDVNGSDELASECAFSGGAVMGIDEVPGSLQPEVVMPGLQCFGVFEGYLLSEGLGGRVPVGFQVEIPKGSQEPATHAVDAAMLGGLRSQDGVSVFQTLVYSNGVKSEYDGRIEVSDGVVDVRFACPADASSEERDAAHMQAIGREIILDSVQIGEFVSTPVAVVGSNAEGSPEIYITRVGCSAAQYANGEHYDLAKAKAEDQGIEPDIAIDPRDAGWAALSPQFVLDSLAAEDRALSEADEQDDVCVNVPF